MSEPVHAATAPLGSYTGEEPLESSAGELEDAIDRAADLLTVPRSERVRALFNFDPFDYQAAVLDSPVSRKLWVCGRQVGKTETAGVVPADWVLTHPGEDALIVAEYQETADELFERTKDHFAELGDPGTVGIEKPNTQTYELDTGARVLSRTVGGSSSGGNQRGKLPSCVVAEEAALISGNTFDQVLRPMFATHDDFELLLVSTARGRQGYLWDKWKDADGEKWAPFRVPTSASPLVSEQWLADMKEDVDTLTWRQEYLGRFVETGTEYLPESLVEPAQQLELPERQTEGAVLGVDPAGKGADRSVYISVDLEGNVFDVRARDTETVPESVGRIKALNNQYGYELIYVESNGLGAGVLDYSELELERVEGYNTSQQSRQAMYRNLKTAFESGDVALPPSDSDPHRRLANELTELTYDFSPTGILQVEHPPGGHDDFPDALAIAFAARRDHVRSSSREQVQTRENPAGTIRRSRDANRKRGFERVRELR